MLAEQAAAAKRARAEAGEHEHCWHSYEMVVSDPTTSKDICCWCGLFAVVRGIWETKDHGTFMPLSVVVRRG